MRPARLPGFPYTGGYRYFLTMCCRNRQSAFVDAVFVSRVACEIPRTAHQHQFAVLAYTFMPNHLHILVEGADEDARLQRFTSLFRRRATLAAERTFPNGLWQKGYYERVLRRDEDSAQVIGYILANPVRAGIVDDPLAYLFSWSVLTHEDTGPLQPSGPCARPS
ncbi:MAG: transposase [Acidimicrobiia bacterium]|nr:transposase [Acidimicrobiia bacterium]